MILPYKVIIIPICAMIGAAAGGAIEDHTISIASVLAVGGVVLPGCWWLGKRFQSIEDRFKERIMRSDEHDRRFDQIDSRLASIGEKLLTLPCQEPQHGKHSTRQHPQCGATPEP